MRSGKTGTETEGNCDQFIANISRTLGKIKRISFYQANFYNSTHLQQNFSTIFCDNKNSTNPIPTKYNPTCPKGFDNAGGKTITRRLATSL